MSLLINALRKSGKTESQSGALSQKPAGEISESVGQANSVKRWPIFILLIISGIIIAGGVSYGFREVAKPDEELPKQFAPPVVAQAVLPIETSAAPLKLVKIDAQIIEEAPVASLKKSPARKIKTAAPSVKKHNKLPSSRSLERAIEAPRKELTEGKRNTTGILQHADYIDIILIDAYALYGKGEYPKAWLRYQEAYAIDPKNHDALLGLAVIAQRQGNDEIARRYYREALHLDPRDPVAHAGLSTMGNGNSVSKESRLKQLISQQPDSAALHFALGVQFVMQLRWADAQQSYFVALGMEPTNALFAFNLASSLDHMGQRKAAINYYQQALQFDALGTSGFNRGEVQQRINELVLVQ
ncbi:MAG: tetratricopeptide repeat protein [Gallionellaceae bacterium]|jgi:tetratricopeptide (TPR) repeat protein